MPLLPQVTLHAFQKVVLRRSASGGKGSLAIFSMAAS